MSDQKDVAKEIVAKENCIDELKLPNNLVVRFLNNSRKLVGDRWYVCLTVEIPIPVKPEYFIGENDPEKAYERFVEKFGKTYLFRYQKERNFIDEDEVEKLLEKLKEDFLKTNLNYLKSERFAGMCIRKAFRDLNEKEKLTLLHQEAIKRADSI